MRMGRWVVWGWVALAGVALAPLTANAAPYAARVRWQPSADASVAGYRVYMQAGTGSMAMVVDAGMPALASDGTLSAVVSGLAPCVTHGFGITAYRADGSESPVSNE